MPWHNNFKNFHVWYEMAAKRQANGSTCARLGPRGKPLRRLAKDQLPATNDHDGLPGLVLFFTGRLAREWTAFASPVGFARVVPMAGGAGG